MADENFLVKAGHKITQNSLAFFRFATRRATDKVTGAASNPLAAAWGLGASYVIDAYISYRDYKYEEDRLRGFYEPEIAARLGKLPHDVTTRDLKAAGEDNPLIAEALKRNKTNRNLSFAISAIAITGAVIAVHALGLGVLAGLAVGASLFVGTEIVLEKIGKKMFGLSEPDLNEVGADPRLQHTLSVPSQVRYLEQLQSRKVPISQEQVMTLFTAANPALAARIESQYGAKFTELPAYTKEQAALEMGAQYGVEQLTDDLNNRMVRAQELAFIAYRQESGVKRLDSPYVTRLEQVNAQLHEKLAAAQNKMGEMSQYAKEHIQSGAKVVADKSRDALSVVKDKLCFGKSEVSAAIPQENPEQGFVARFASTPAGGSKVDQLNAQRQQTANVSQMAVVGT